MWEAIRILGQLIKQIVREVVNTIIWLLRKWIKN